MKRQGKPLIRICQRCGCEYDKRIGGTDRYCSDSCWLAEMKENAEQLHKKSGPAWEKWKAGMKYGMQKVGVLE
jgi:hypothetical protein